MFLHLSVSHSVHLSVSHSVHGGRGTVKGVLWKGVPWKGSAMKRIPRKGVLWKGVVWRGFCEKGGSVKGGAMKGVLWRPPLPFWSTRGWYASYWNAFLLLLILSIKQKRLHHLKIGFIHRFQGKNRLTMHKHVPKWNWCRGRAFGQYNVQMWCKIDYISK